MINSTKNLPRRLSAQLAANMNLTLTWTSSGISTLSPTKKPTPTSPQHPPPPAFVKTALALLRAYFRGHPTAFLEIPLDPPSGTPFQLDVWTGCRTIPWGQTCSYAQLASIIGRPKAARAVGNALANNPIPIIVPCHRVVRADGTLGRFGLGPDMKRLLLNLEQQSAAT
jgi:methylated-DNA-[protein]-cysteine S-methyltransferase